MPRNSDDVQKFIRIIFTDHKSYWKNQSGELRSIKMHMRANFGRSKNITRL